MVVATLAVRGWVEAVLAAWASAVAARAEVVLAVVALVGAVLVVEAPVGVALAAVVLAEVVSATSTQPHSLNNAWTI
jgi:hypothetical protein